VDAVDPSLTPAPSPGLIFVERDAVRGPTTAAAVWPTTAQATAAGAGLPVPA
jgi:putative Mg2+ transporter-C (MgtC) family protein